MEQRESPQLSGAMPPLAGDGLTNGSTPTLEHPDGPPSGRDGDRSWRIAVEPIDGPVPVAWREGTLTRAKELEALCNWTRRADTRPDDDVLAQAIQHHLEAAREAAKDAPLRPRKRFRPFRNGPLIERAKGNLDAAEAHLLTIAPDEYILGQMPSLLNHVQCHLPRSDARRQEFERIARTLGITDGEHPLLGKEPDPETQKSIVAAERRKIINIVRGASSAALREQVRLRSFRNIVVVATVLMTVLAVGIAIMGYLRPTLIPLCFAPEEAGKATVVCPTAQSEPFVPVGTQAQRGVPTKDIDVVVQGTANVEDLIVVEVVGLAAAAVAAAAALRRIKGSSERFGLPVALAALKLPTGALTAVLGLLLMRGQFVPGLSALDTSAQILAWALVFGYAQQLFTRLVDQQGQTVLNDIRGANRSEVTPAP